MLSLQKLEHLVVDALEVVEFKLVRKQADLENDELSFKPEMAHQIFGQQETIFGYEDLKIRIYYSAGPLNMYLGVDYKRKIGERGDSEIKADDIIGAITEKLPDGCYFVNMDEFLKTLERGKFIPFGQKLAEHIYEDRAEDKTRLFEIYYCDCNSPAFLSFFSRFQTFILWFVDAASYIEVDDPRWKYFICYEKYRNDNGDYEYMAVGYTTVYEYWAYPAYVRPRISQMLVLPPFQKLGIGTKFLETIYQWYCPRKDVLDITVEDPSENFTRLRNFVDARLCLPLKSFRADVIKKGFNKEMTKESREKLKLNAKQTRIVYEILRLYHTNVNNDEEYESYRLDVKHRLAIPHYKQKEDIKRLEKRKIDTEWLRVQLPSKEQQIEDLAEKYKGVEEDYVPIVEKLRLC